MFASISQLFLIELCLLGQSSKPANVDWPYTSGERRGSHYSPLDQIRSGNVKQLGLAWSYDTATTRGLEATPVVVLAIIAIGIWRALQMRSLRRLRDTEPSSESDGGPDNIPREDDGWRPPHGMTALPTPVHILEAVKPPAPASGALPLERASELMKAGYLELENGYTRMDNGIVYVAALTRMPGVRAEMVDWWFANLATGVPGRNHKYVWWHPIDHVKAWWYDGTDGSKKGQRTPPGASTTVGSHWGHTSYVFEYLGKRRGYPLLFVRIRVRDPASYGLRQTSDDVFVCARGGSPDHGIDLAHVIHHIRNTEEGCEMRSRFWYGDIRAMHTWPSGWLINLVGNTGFFRRTVIKALLGKDLLEAGQAVLLHCGEEMNQLSTFVAEAYARYSRRARKTERSMR